MKDINFFSPYQGKKKETISTQMYIYGATAIVGVFILSTLMFNSYKIIYLNNSISTCKLKINDEGVQKKLKDSNGITRKIEILNKYEHGVTEIYKVMDERDVISNKLLDSISSTLPSDVYFKSIDVTAGSIGINAVSKSRKAIGEIEHNLKKLTDIQDVYIGTISQNGAVDGEYSFDIKCVLKEVK